MHNFYNHFKMKNRDRFKSFRPSRGFLYLYLKIVLIDFNKKEIFHTVTQGFMEKNFLFGKIPKSIASNFDFFRVHEENPFFICEIIYIKFSFSTIGNNY